MKSIISGALIATALVACLTITTQAKSVTILPATTLADTGKMAKGKMDKMESKKMDKMDKMDKMAKSKMKMNKKMAKKKMAKDSTGKM